MNEQIKLNNPQTTILMKNISTAIETKAKMALRNSGNAAIILDNKLFLSFADNSRMHFRDIANKFEQLFNEQISTSKVEQFLFTHHLKSWDARQELFSWTETAMSLFIAAFNGSEAAVTELKNHLKTNGTSRGEHRERYRVLIFRLCHKYPKLYCFNNQESLFLLGNNYMKYLVEEILQCIADNNEMSRLLQSHQQNHTSKQDLELAEYKQRIKSLEEAALRSTMMLNDLQDEFDEEIKNVKQQELTTFFSQLNSEKYGCILDQLLVANSGFNKLSKEKYVMPVELNGVRIMIKRLIQFTKDCHINPIMKQEASLQVTAKDIESCEYIGTPFNDENEQKKVRVISPGWIYQDKDVQISRPILKEVTSNGEL